MHTEFLSQITNTNEARRELKAIDKCWADASNETEFWQCAKELVLHVEIEQAPGYDQIRDTTFNYKVTQYSGRKLMLTFEFDNALQISPNVV